MEKRYDIPSDANLLCTYELWQENTDTNLHAEERLHLKATYSLFQNRSGYYLFIKFEENIKQNKFYLTVSDDIGKQIVTLSEEILEEIITNQVTEFVDHLLSTVTKFTMTKFTEKDLKKVSKKQKP